MAFADLVQLALIGTERFSGTELPGGAPLKPYLEQLDLSRKESSFLSAAALATQYERAGMLPHKEAVQEAAAATEESLRRASENANSLLTQILAGNETDLLEEWLQLAVGTQQIVAPEIIPQLLEKGVGKPALHYWLGSAVGNRGRWLAEQNSACKWAVSSGVTIAPEQWEVGDLHARAAFLRQTRVVDRKKAVELLNSTWKTEPPETRIAFIEFFSVNLGPEDEAFLELALTDKRKEVRQTAAAHLAKLPDSALSQRMAERLRKFLEIQRGKKNQIKLEITLPPEFQKDWQKDGLEQKPPSKVSEKIWWIMQMMQVVPVAKYQEWFGLSLHEFVAASLDTDWKKEFFQAWSSAADWQRNGDLALLLIKAATEEEWHSSISKLLSLLPAEDQQRFISELLGSKKPNNEHLMDWILAVKSPWSASFSRMVLRWLRAQSEKENSDWRLRSNIKMFALRLSPEVFAEAMQGWNQESKGWDYWAPAVEELLKTIQFRADMHHALLRGIPHTT